MEEVLKMRNVSKTYDNSIKALKDVSFEAYKGEVISIIGPSGSGKSTLLRCINRMVNASEGEVNFMGLDVVSANKKQIKEIRKNIGMIFQHYNLVYRLNVLENVLHGRLGHYSTWKSALSLFSANDVEHAAKLLDMLGLGDRLYDKCSQLSGGQKQRVGIARALIQEPKILLCDEPIASLDPQSSKVIMEHLKDIAKRLQIPVLINLHQVDVAISYSDRILGMHEGQLVFSGKPEQLKEETIETIYGVSIHELISKVEGDKS